MAGNGSSTGRAIAVGFAGWFVSGAVCGLTLLFGRASTVYAGAYSTGGLVSLAVGICAGVAEKKRLPIIVLSRAFCHCGFLYRQLHFECYALEAA